MSNNLKIHLSTGEFAKLCNVTKETLFHYDSIGILKPEIVLDNGYRYYSAFQFFDLDLIHVLKAAGTSLKDIKQYMNHRNKQTFLTILHEKNDFLAKEKLRIEQMQYRLTKAIELTEFAMKESFCCPKTIFCEEEHLIAIPVATKELTPNETIEYLRKHFTYCTEHNLSEELPTGSIIPKKELLAHNCLPSHYYSKIPAPYDGENYVKKPSGTYATILHHGYYDSIAQSYRKLFQYIEEASLKICGDGYEYELINYFATPNNEDYVIQIFIQVESI